MARGHGNVVKKLSPILSPYFFLTQRRKGRKETHGSAERFARFASLRETIVFVRDSHAENNLHRFSWSGRHAAEITGSQHLSRGNMVKPFPGER